MARRHLGLAFALLAGCGDPSTPTPPPPPPPPPIDPNVVATVELTLASSGMLPGDTIAATVVVKNGLGAALTGRATSLTSSNEAVAQWQSDGRLAARSVGSGVTVTATVEGKSGTAPVEVWNDTRFAFLAATNSTGPWVPIPELSHHAGGGTMTITRNGTGDFAVRFQGMANRPGMRTGIIAGVVGVGNGVNNTYCNVPGWTNAGADLDVQVRCFNLADAPRDASFSLLVTGAMALGGRYGFVRADSAAMPSYQVRGEVAFASGLGGAAVVRNSAGVYTVTLAGAKRTGSDKEVVMVSGAGIGVRCGINGWTFDGFDATVQCRRAGALTDSPFHVVILSQERTGKKVGYLWANNALSPDYTPSTTYSYATGGGSIKAGRSAPGAYSGTFNGLSMSGPMAMFVGAYGGDGACTIGGWNTTSPDTHVSAHCFNAAGAALDIRHVLLAIQ